MRLFIFALAMSLFACGRQEEASVSDLQYRLGSSSYAGLTRFAHEPEIKICYKDSSNSQKHKDDVVFSVLAWMEPIKEIASEPVVESVSLVPMNSSGCHASVYVGNYNPARTSLGSRPKVYINYSGWFGSKTVTLHEFGHAFGLLDTYRGRGGSCQSGQPDSVMCRASYDHLKEDDILGIQEMYRRVQKNPAAFANENLEPMILY